MLKSLSVLTVLSSFLLHIGCTVPTIDAIDEDTLEQLQQQSNGAQSDAGTQPQTATDAGKQEQAAMDAGEQEQAATDAGEQEQAATDAGEQEQAATDAGDLACTPCSDGFVHITGTCDCVAEEESDAGSVACTPCEDGFEHETGTCNCVDIDDCTAGNNGGCGDNATCHNSVTPGNPPICTCDLAYELQGDTCVAQCTGDCTTAYSDGYGSHLGRICSDVGNECTIDNSGAQCLSDEECHYLDSLNETRCIQTCGYKRYFRFAVAEDFACGIQIEEPGIDCIGNIDPAHYQHLTGQYDDIACNGDSVCCVKELGGMTTPQNGFIQCFSSDESLPSWATPQTINTVVDSLPQTEFAYPTDITLGDNHGCFQYGAGVSHGYCWGTADHCDDASSNCEPSNPLACVSSERLCSDGYPVNDASINFIKTSATNTCVLVENDNFDRELNCTGRKGYGLGGETDIAPENSSLFPFYHLEDSTSITSGSQFDMLSASDTNIVFSVEELTITPSIQKKSVFEFLLPRQ